MSIRQKNSPGSPHPDRPNCAPIGPLAWSHAHPSATFPLLRFFHLRDSSPLLARRRRPPAGARVGENETLAPPVLPRRSGTHPSTSAAHPPVLAGRIVLPASRNARQPTRRRPSNPCCQGPQYLTDAAQSGWTLQVGACVQAQEHRLLLLLNLLAQVNQHQIHRDLLLSWWQRKQPQQPQTCSMY
ncbi:hypothetical protein GQ55_3G088600 [Panicum hallii var. hallii]|uniref:Uncharacterized protein n=1 Tax=Panicum hallii var. hallii TaxID=1504633 RepID=A0A2T7E7B2_9POAL|nr:hypothetical protein GQ55_3G088600 [Panicum hallii var. hallii]